jgi:hypothetical protein
MTFLSYINNVNNKRLATAQAALALAHAHAEESPDSPEALEAERIAAIEVEKALTRKHKIHDSQGGGATGVGTRMGF